MKKIKQGILGRIQHIHLVGIGGAGMSAIAEVLLKNGLKVSGSDVHISEVTERLKERGAMIFNEHQAENIIGAEVVAHSSAVNANQNPETLEASRLGIPVIKRDELMGEIMRRKAGICVAGTHGKTTTTTMIATMLSECDLEPTALIGGVSDYFLEMGNGGSSIIGEGDLMVIEADEYDRTFLKLTPTIAVMTTLEAEHLDIYKDINDLKGAFNEFGDKVPFFGAVVLCNDEENLRAIRPRLKRKVITYGIVQQSDIRATDIEQKEGMTKYKAWNKKNLLGTIEIQAGGLHNVNNSLAAIAVGLEIGLSFEDICQGLSKFKSVRRRFDIKFNKGFGMPIVIDDYAHHPTEITATIEAARSGFPSKRIVAVLQPHLYSRTRDFAPEFYKALSEADEAILTEIYSSREKSNEFIGVTSDLIARGDQNIMIVEKERLVETLMNRKLGDEIYLIMGAGDINKYTETFVKELEKTYGS